MERKLVRDLRKATRYERSYDKESCITEHRTINKLESTEGESKTTGSCDIVLTMSESRYCLKNGGEA